MVPEVLKATQQTIHHALAMGMHPSWAEVQHAGGKGRWYRHALTSLVLAVGSDDVVFVSGRGTPVTSDGFTVGGDIYTGERLISLDARVDRLAADVQWTVTVRRLSDVSSIRVHAEGEPFTETMDGEWPVLTEATFVFESGDEVTVGTTNSADRQALAGFVEESIQRLS